MGQLNDDPGGAELGLLGPLLDRVLAEDLGRGDVTARATVAASAIAAGEIVAERALIFCGAPILRGLYARLDAGVSIETMAGEGQSIASAQVVVRLRGSARSLLAGERCALNLLQRACGVATRTRAFVDASAGRARIADTRKTMPGLRAIDRYAVRCGGGHNHREDLGGGVLIKENHIRCAGGVANAVRAAKAAAPHVLRIQCEVTTLAELEQAAAAGADAVLLDNMDDGTLRIASETWRGKILLEASGGMTEERVARIAGWVDVVSVGAITHSAPAADLAFEITAVEVGGGRG